MQCFILFAGFPVRYLNARFPSWCYIVQQRASNCLKHHDVLLIFTPCTAGQSFQYLLSFLHSTDNLLRCRQILNMLSIWVFLCAFNSFGEYPVQRSLIYKQITNRLYLIGVEPLQYIGETHIKGHLILMVKQHLASGSRNSQTNNGRNKRKSALLKIVMVVFLVCLRKPPWHTQCILSPLRSEIYICLRSFQTL